MRFNWWYLHAGTVLAGAAFGFASWALQFSGYTAIKIVAFDKLTVVGSLTPTPIMDTNFLLEYAKSSNLAARAAKKASNPEAARLLEAAAQGPGFLVNVRAMQGAAPMTGPSSIELRFGSADPAVARAVVDAVGAEIVDFQATKTGAVVAALAELSNKPQAATTDSLTAQIIGKTALESAVSMAITKSQSGMALDTVVLRPHKPYFLMAAGALGFFMFSILVRFRRQLMPSRREEQADAAASA